MSNAQNHWNSVAIAANITQFQKLSTSAAWIVSWVPRPAKNHLKLYMLYTPNTCLPAELSAWHAALADVLAVSPPPGVASVYGQYDRHHDCLPRCGRGSCKALCLKRMAIWKWLTCHFSVVTFYWMLGLFVKLWTREVTGGEEGSQWTVKNTSSTDWNYKSMVHLIALGNPGSRLTIIIQMAAI